MLFTKIVRLTTLICFMVILFAHKTEQRRRGGSFRRYSGSSSYRSHSNIRRTSYNSLSSSKKIRNKYSTYHRINTKGIVSKSSSLVASKRNYKDRKFLTNKEDFAFFDSDRLDAFFEVNGNEFNTAVLLPLDEDTVLNCIVLPKTTEDICPAIFRYLVNSDRQFLLQSDFNYSKNKSINTKDEISVCCKSSHLIPNLVGLIILALVGLYICFIDASS